MNERNLLILLACWLTAVGIHREISGQEAAPRWFKGNLHTHSLWSDGNDFPEMICDWYAEQGYHFLGLSDHNILSRGEKWIAADLPSQRGAIDGVKRYRARFGEDWVETREQDGKLQVRLKTLAEFRDLFEKKGEFLMIQSEEITDRFGRLPIHINATNLEELIRPQGGESVQDTMRRNLLAVKQQSVRLKRPIVAHLNHPNFGYGVSVDDLAAVVEERFFEVYNGHPGVNHFGDEGHIGVERIWDVANTIRIARMKQPPLFGLATDDSHNYFGNRGSSPGRGWVMVQAAELNGHDITRSIESGRFYASSGVTLKSVQFDKSAQRLKIEIQTEPGISYRTQFIGTLRTALNGESSSLSENKGVGKVLQESEGPQASFNLPGEELYVRACVISSKPHPNPSYTDQVGQAWTQPVGWGRHLR